MILWQPTMDAFQAGSEEKRQAVLVAYRDIVEVALGRKLSDDLVERTIELEEVVANMRLVRLCLKDRVVLGSIGGLLIDSGIRKGRSIDERIPDDEVLAMKGKALQYLRHTRGRL
ncbi:MAG: hypothetical protein IID31_13100 [Planctomycetes bacterium]|nr:hypothetical protein [Planctomycetota bacterium]